MRRILKGQEPHLLGQQRRIFKQNHELGYAQLNKGDLRPFLLSAQGYLCVFCMRRIGNRPDDTKIAHFYPQSAWRKHSSHGPAAPQECGPLDWMNLFAACHGKWGSHPSDETCDTRQKDGVLDLQLHPTSGIEVHTSLKYLMDGTLVVVGSDLDQGAKGIADAQRAQANQLQEQVGQPTLARSLPNAAGLLNLNHRQLMKAREAVLDEIKARLPKHEDWTTKNLEHELKRWQAPDPQGRMKEFVGVAEWWLHRRLSRDRT